VTGTGFFPLLEVFQELRHRDFPLGVDEYVLALRAMEAGLGDGSREDLLLMCQSLWARSPEECEQVADVLDGLLPLTVSPEYLDSLDDAPAGPDQAEEDEPTAGDAAPAPREADAGSGPRPADDAAGGPRDTERSGDQPSGHSSETQPGQHPGYQHDWLPVPQGPGQVAAPVRRAAPRTWQLNPRFDFVGSLPVSTRQISQAWRHYRRMSRNGQRIEYDVEATVAQLYREGILLEPVLIPRRTNQARLLVLEDAGGSMTPFRYVTSSLVAGAQHVGLARVDVRYFHDVPWDVVYRDPDQHVSVPLDEAAAPFAHGAILIYSDAGAARGGTDHGRVSQTAEMLATLRRHTTSIAWVNPVPRDRWQGTTAAAIRDLEGGLVPMFPLDHLGLTDAVSALRGRRY
jgi:uncharacterized protein with von Willebrand factor type A (vWA) domain